MVYHAKYGISNISRLTKNCSLFPIFFLSSSSPTTKFEFNRVRKKSWPDIVHWKVNWKSACSTLIEWLISTKSLLVFFPGLDYFFYPFLPVFNLWYLPGPKTLFLDRYYFHPRVCVCMSVSLCLDYLKLFLTDFDETWQDDL